MDVGVGCLETGVVDGGSATSAQRSPWQVKEGQILSLDGKCWSTHRVYLTELSNVWLLWKGTQYLGIRDLKPFTFSVSVEFWLQYDISILQVVSRIHRCNKRSDILSLHFWGSKESHCTVMYSKQMYYPPEKDDKKQTHSYVYHCDHLSYVCGGILSSSPQEGEVRKQE